MNILRQYATKVEKLEIYLHQRLNRQMKDSGVKPFYSLKLFYGNWKIPVSINENTF